MKTAYRLLTVGVFCISVIAQAAKSDLERGGLGFLYPDFNDSTNPGHFAKNRSYALMGSYAKDSGETTSSFGTSLAMGMGSFGFGAFGTRDAAHISDSTGVDTAGVGIGYSPMKDRLLLGASYQKALSPSTSNGTVGGSVAFMPNGMMGLSMGLGVSTRLSSSTQSGVVALGYGLRNNLRFEANAAFSRGTSISFISYSGFINWANGPVFLSGGYTRLDLTAQNMISARGGFVFSKFDLSAMVSNTLNQTNGLTWGGAARVMF